MVRRISSSALKVGLAYATLVLLIRESGASMPFTTQQVRGTLSNHRKVVSGYRNLKHAAPEISTHTHRTMLTLRGGVTRRNTKKRGGGRTASLYSSKRTATGKTKVGAGKKKAAALSDSVQKYRSILPLTRVYITMVATCTLLGVVLGDEVSQALLALDPIRTIYGWELWRPITAATFLGPPSVSWLMNAYYLFEYGSTLERNYGAAQHVIFLLSQVTFLTVLSMVFGLPFFGPSIITAMLHVLSRTMPNQKVKWLIFTVPYWSLPLGLMATDVLQAQGSPMAALPHVLGILSGHFYFFHKFVWPKLGGEDWLVAPEFLTRWLDPETRASKKDASVKSALASRRKGRGRKLGGS